MSVSISSRPSRWSALRAGAGAQDGFTMVIAMLTLLITGMLAGAVFIAVQSDSQAGIQDLNQKQAYYAAQAGLQAYLYNLDQNGNYWQTCSNDVQGQTSVPGSSTGEQYSYQPVYVSGYSAANCAASPISALVDPTSGTITMEFTGYANNGRASQGIVASFRKDSPLDYLWYTVYEATDPIINPGHTCAVYYRSGRDSACNLYWVTGAQLNGPAYTQDQFLINGAPVFGRTAADQIKTVAPTTACAAGCGSAVFNGTVVTSAPMISPPADNSGLLTDATNHGQVFYGTTNITLAGTSATVVNCPGTTSTSPCTTSTINLTSSPIIYVANATGCTPPVYTPYNTTYSFTSAGNAYGCAGDVYVQGNYTTSATIAAAHDIVIPGNITTTNNGTPTQLTGASTLGLVANDFVRMMHQVTGTRGSTMGSCGSPAVTNTNPHSITIDAAILAIQHEFVLDNFDCGAPLGTETITGSIAETFADADGMSNSSGTVTSGYIDKYTYDDRLKVTLPPYLFDIATAGWHIYRENLCTAGGSGSGAC